MTKLLEAQQAFTFDDFVLVPQYSDIKSRKDPSLSVNMLGFNYRTPIVASPMNTITEEDMLVTMAEAGGVGVLHRYMSLKSQLKIVSGVKRRLAGLNIPLDNNGTPAFYVAVATNGDSAERVERLSEAGVFGFCIDVANGHNENCLQAIRNTRKINSNALIMSGNVVTYEGAYNLAKAGCNSIRVGVGPGSLCSTRQVTAHGLPQLSAIEDCVRIKTEQYMGTKNLNYAYRIPADYSKAFPNVAIIADGGIRKSGDIVKCFAIGADAVMLGSMLAGCQETPGEIIEENGKLFKYYQGMASEEAREKWFDKSKSGMPAEGVSTKVPYMGKLASKVVDGLCKSVKVGLSYSGAIDTKELQEKAVWRRVTGSGYTEGTPHGKK